LCKAKKLFGMQIITIAHGKFVEKKSNMGIKCHGTFVFFENMGN
jgi:hypothetical protein